MRNRAASPACADGKNNGLRNPFYRCPGSTGLASSHLAVATKERIAALPDIPTLAQVGVLGCESDTWNALTAPPKTPAAIVAILNDAANEAVSSPYLLDQFAKVV
jgi:tripartite-type tricarboxylate transporter receptor subunit TctC